MVGNIAFLKHDEEGETFGLNEVEKDRVIDWINSHRYLTMDCGLLKGKEKSNKYVQSFVVDEYETIEHRRRIEDTKKMVEEMGGDIIHI